jgi:hypothetical protein
MEYCLLQNVVEVNCYPNISIAYRILVAAPSTINFFKTRIIEKTTYDQQSYFQKLYI